jgi:hypothetical protein
LTKLDRWLYGNSSAGKPEVYRTGEVGAPGFNLSPDLRKPKIRPMARNQMDVRTVLPVVLVSRLVSLVGIEEIPIGIIRRVEQMSCEAPSIFKKLEHFGDCLLGFALQQSYAILRHRS